MRRAALLLLPLGLALAACGANGPFRDRGYDYLKADPGKPLVYPEGMAPLASREAWPVPDPDKRRVLAPGEKPGVEIPPPPRIVTDDMAAPAPTTGSGQPVPASRVLLTADGNGYPVLMLDLDFNWAWQEMGDALKDMPGVTVEDLDREQAIYFLVIEGKRGPAGEPFQLKLNFTANGIQVALQVDEDTLAERELSAPLMEKIRDGLLK